MSEEGGSPGERALAAVLDLLECGALLFAGERLVCVKASPRAAELLGLSADAIVGRTRDEILGSIAPADDAAARAIEAMRSAGAEGRPRADILFKHAPSRTVEWLTAPAGDGRVDVLVDRTEERALRAALARAEAKMAATALVDELTGLANRRHFEAEIDREHRRSQRAWASYAVARIDVDGMAKLNAELGQDAGDRLLRRLGEELKVARREYDLVARWESDELIVLLPGIDAASVKAVLARSLGAMRDAARALTGHEVTFCTGVALWIPPSVEAAADIVSRSGTALEAAKLMGAGSTEIDASTVEWKDDTGAS